jgi:hypothetical protein
MDAGPPPPPGGGGGAGGSGSGGGGGAPRRGKGEDEASGSGGAANEVVPVFGGDAYTQLFMLIMLLLGLFKARPWGSQAALRCAGARRGRCGSRECVWRGAARARACCARLLRRSCLARAAADASCDATRRGAQASTQRCTC